MERFLNGEWDPRESPSFIMPHDPSEGGEEAAEPVDPLPMETHVNETASALSTLAGLLASAISTSSSLHSLPLPDGFTPTVRAQKELGVFSSNAPFVISSHLKKAGTTLAPASVAEAIVLFLAGQSLPPYIKSVSVGGAGFVNFAVTDAFKPLLDAQTPLAAAKVAAKKTFPKRKLEVMLRHLLSNCLGHHEAVDVHRRILCPVFEVPTGGAP
jgi:hypothetical protein